jgi:hypothetical protein
MLAGLASFRYSERWLISYRCNISGLFRLGNHSSSTPIAQGEAIHDLFGLQAGTNTTRRFDDNLAARLWPWRID